MQSNSQTQREGATHKSGGFILRLSQSEWMPQFCQWIAGDPTPKEIRKNGADAYKCLEPVSKIGSPYCLHHHSIAYTPLTPQAKSAASEE